MEILFTECPIASVLLADWSKSPNWWVLYSNRFLPWSTFGVISVLATIYSNRFFQFI